MKNLEDLDGYIQVPVNRLSQPKILWLNLREAEQDIRFVDLNRDQKRYEALLIDLCGFVKIDAETPLELFGTDTAMAFADRYGGDGIGKNGGSGRAGLLNGYYVKGLGRTDLVSSLTDRDHASGGAFLEEAVRETIYGEITALEFPHGGVSTLAIIDTGIEKHWSSGSRSHERRVLLIRRQFLRPAHFVRASNFVSRTANSGLMDRHRVEANLKNIFESASNPWSFNKMLARLAGNIAEQLAYGYIHLLVHGSPTLSNMTLSGQLVDFGAASSVPGWENVATMRKWRPIAVVVRELHTQMNIMIDNYLRYAGDGDRGSLNTEQIHTIIDHMFHKRLGFELLRCLGATRKQASILLGPTRNEKIDTVISNYISRFQSTQIDLLSSFTWPDLTRIVELSPTDGLASELGQFLHESGAGRDVACLKLRPKLEKSHLREAIFLALEPAVSNVNLRRSIKTMIDTIVVENRRDTRQAVDRCDIVGFTYEDGNSCVILKSIDNSTSVLLREGQCT